MALCISTETLTDEARSVRQALDRTAVERRRRRTVGRIDRALEACEQLNLAYDGIWAPAAPSWVVELIENLAQNFEPLAHGRFDAVTAHEALFDLQTNYLPEPPVPHAEEEEWLAGGGGLEAAE